MLHQACANLSVIMVKKIKITSTTTESPTFNLHSHECKGSLTLKVKQRLFPFQRHRSIEWRVWQCAWKLCTQDICGIQEESYEIKAKLCDVVKSKHK